MYIDRYLLHLLCLVNPVATYLKKYVNSEKIFNVVSSKLILFHCFCYKVGLLYFGTFIACIKFLLWKTVKQNVTFKVLSSTPALTVWWNSPASPSYGQDADFYIYLSILNIRY